MVLVSVVCECSEAVAPDGDDVGRFCRSLLAAAHFGRVMVTQVAPTLRKLNSNICIHRDVNARNVLIFAEDEPFDPSQGSAPDTSTLEFSLVDFGSSIDVKARRWILAPCGVPLTFRTVEFLPKESNTVQARHCSTRVRRQTITKLADASTQALAQKSRRLLTGDTVQTNLLMTDVSLYVKFLQEVHLGQGEIRGNVTRGAARGHTSYDSLDFDVDEFVWAM